MPSSLNVKFSLKFYPVQPNFAWFCWLIYLYFYSIFLWVWKVFLMQTNFTLALKIFSVKSSMEKTKRSIQGFYWYCIQDLQTQIICTSISSTDLFTFLGEKLEKLKAVDVDKLQKELHEEKARNHELKEKLKHKQKSSSSKLQRYISLLRIIFKGS